MLIKDSKKQQGNNFNTLNKTKEDSIETDRYNYIKYSLFIEYF